MSNKYKGKRENIKPKKERKKLTFSMILTIWSMTLATTAFALSYIWAYLGLNPVSEIATTVLGALGLGSNAGYYIKTAFEKNSRNKYHIDEEGIPYNLEISDEGGEG